MATSSDAAGRKHGFDFTQHMRRLCADIARRCPALRHVQIDRIAIAFAQARKSVSYGLQASLTPLRFQGGAREGLVRGRRVRVQPVLDRQGREMLYILTFYLPRFQDQPYREKLITVFHELWHISPRFDGDLRRHPGRCYAHTHSQAEYDKLMGDLVDHYLALGPPDELLAFLRCDFRALQRDYGRVLGVKLPRPKLLR